MAPEGYVGEYQTALDTGVPVEVATGVGAAFTPALVDPSQR